MEIVEKQTSIAWRSTIPVPINANYGCIMYRVIPFQSRCIRATKIVVHESLQPVELGREEILMRAHSLSREISVAVG